MLRHLVRILHGEDVEGAETPEAKQRDVGEFDFEEKDDWSLERDCELARLERENAILRRMLVMDMQEIDPNTNLNITDHSVDRSRLPGSHPGSSKHITQPPQLQKRILAAVPGAVGPYGTYKKSKTEA